MRYAYIQKGIVVEVIEPFEDVSLEDRFHPAFVADCRPIPDGLTVEQGYCVAGDAFAPPPPPPEADVRPQRDALISATDWTQLPDVPLATREAWATYRQALRDVPQQKDFPQKVDWPTPPQ